MLDLISEILIDELVVESELCVTNTSCHYNGLSNELAVIYPPLVIMKPCAIMREMDKVFNDACDIKLRDINILKVLPKSKNKHKTAKICEISSHNELKRPSTDEIENSTNFRKKRSFVNHMPTQIIEGNLYQNKIVSKKVKKKHSRMETEARDVINLGQRNHNSNRQAESRSYNNDDECCIKGKGEIDYKAHGVKRKSCALRILHKIIDTGKKNKIDYKARRVKWKNYALTDFLNIQGYG